MKPRDPGKDRPARRREGLLAALSVLALLSPTLRAQSTAKDDDSSVFSEPSPLLQWNPHDRFDRVRFMDAFATHLILSQDPPRPQAFHFFPPVPPLLDSDIPVIAPLDPGPPAPELMSGFVGEIFYPVLATRLAANDLPREMRARILSYHDAKIALTDEIRARILALKDAGPLERTRQLQALAAREAGPIADLVGSAEKIRQDLRERNVFGLPTDVHEARIPARKKIRSVADTPSDSAGLLLESEAILDAAFYQDGLSPVQRKFLFESAIELRDRAVPKTGEAQAGTRILSFSPATARIRIPADLGEAMEQKIRDYLAAKDELKSELRDMLHRNSDASEVTVAGAVADLAQAQAERIARVQGMAESIREGLALMPNPPGPPVPRSLPPELASRISLYRTHKVQLLKALRAMLAAPTPTGNPDPGTPKPDDKGTGAASWMHDGTTTSDVRAASLTVSAEEFNRTQTDLIAQVNREQADIREGLAAYVRSTNGQSDRKSINDLLRDFEEARMREEIWEKYRDYQTAVLVPGLSPAQRQLIFDTAIGELGLPLPTGDKVN